MKNGENSNNEYKLFSELVHDGLGSGAGHYYAYINCKLK